MSWEGFFPRERSRKKGPSKRRTGRRPEGEEEEDGGRTQEENDAIRFVVEVAEQARQNGVTFMWMHPEDSLAWKLPFVLESAGSGGFEMVDGAPLVFRGGGSVKYRVLTNAKWFRAEVSRPSKRFHLEDEEGWAILAAALVTNLALRTWNAGPTFRSRAARGKVRGPPLSASWGDPRRWIIWARGRWEFQEHSNVLEARAGLMAVRNLLRRSVNWGKRVLLLTDNQASAGAFSKGRSSEPSFTSLCRRLSALKLCTGSATFWRYVETFRNPADGPSRGQSWAGILGAPNPHSS
jgi:hypothetical protein